MTCFFDTSVLVAALLWRQEGHEDALAWLNRARNGEFSWAVAAHSLAEFYSTLTGMPPPYRRPPDRVIRLLQDDVIGGGANVVSLSPTEYLSVIGQMAKLGVTGGAIYDALIAFTAQKAKADKLLTFNIDHFKRVWPEGVERIVAP